MGRVTARRRASHVTPDETITRPETLVVDLASQSGVTLVAFLRGESMNICTRPDRIKR
jgi:formate dehydrogenase assembly factor FdhD